MKYDYERIALWTIIALLVFMVFFQQRRSGFSIQAGMDSNVFSMFDMMEYKFVSDEKRTAYKDMLKSNAATLTSMTSGDLYSVKIGEIMKAAFNTSTTLSCSNVIIVGECTTYPACPQGMMMRQVGTLKYCICSTTGYVVVPSSTAGRAPTCAASCPSTMARVITELATGQKKCAASCPVPLAGYTCS
jgi:hypothetical protein